MSNEQAKAVMEEITLMNDVGADITFRGRLYSESSYYDEESGVMTRQRLYVTEQNQQVYSIVTSDGVNKDRRVYLLQVDGDMCRINNGLFDVTVQLDLLMTAVRGLCGLDGSGRSEEFLQSLEETLRAVNQ
ncbi:hypothetical protein [Desulfovibrio psychrotolerans]|uniref:Uncharacterized protein n=1 Tax=Desulfovibrio psychrotolerans TaxID=415242 RepID=A0A7J0BSJ4_9BACT|nr:hypothetical protein [Desulfovibrio psychrotolerans]GFM36142.1 hypothetical protein DSM19430T_08260 [Desulfovibrio psychrotolerans]